MDEPDTAATETDHQQTPRWARWLSWLGSGWIIAVPADGDLDDDLEPTTGSGLKRLRS